MEGENEIAEKNQKNEEVNNKTSNVFISTNENDKENKNLNYNNLMYYSPKTKVEILQNESTNSDFVFKIILIGNTGVGKSCLSLRATKGIFKDDNVSTLGFEFFNINIKIDTKVVKLQIWDTCGQEAYRSLISGFYHNTELAIIVYSVTDRKSFEDIEIWLKQLKTHGSADCKVFLIANKIDEEKRLVTTNEGIECKNEHGFMCYMETSAKTGVNSRELFVNVALTLYNIFKDINKDEINNKEKNKYLIFEDKTEDEDCQC